MPLTITVRPAADHEKIVESEEGVMVFDGTDYNASFFMGLVEGDWVVDVSGDDILRWQPLGTFIVKVEDDGGLYRKVNRGTPEDIARRI